MLWKNYPNSFDYLLKNLLTIHKWGVFINTLLKKSLNEITIDIIQALFIHKVLPDGQSYN